MDVGLLTSRYVRDLDTTFPAYISLKTLTLNTHVPIVMEMATPGLLCAYTLY